MTRRPELLSDQGGFSRREPVTALLAAIVGGVVGWTLLFAGLGWGGLLIGAIVASSVATATALLDRSQHLASLLVFGFAFLLLSWPLLWLAVALVRYWITGDSLGS